MKNLRGIKAGTRDIDVVFLLLLGVVATFTLEKLNPILIVSLFVAQIGLMLLRKQGVDFETTRYFWLLMALFLLGPIGLLYTDNIPRGFDMIGRQVSFLLFPLFYCVYRIKRIELLFKVYCTSILLLVFLFEIDTLYRFFYKSDTFPLTLDLFLSYRYTGSNLTTLLEMHNAYFGMYILFANVLLMDYLRTVQSISKFVTVLIVVCVQSLFLFQMIAKTALVLNTLLVLGSIIYILVAQKKMKLLLFSAIVMIAAVFLSQTFLKLPIERIKDRFEELGQGQDADRETRIKLWNAAVPIIKENAFIGVGTGDVEDELHKSYRSKGVQSKSNVHNQYLDYLLGYGAVGLLVFLGVLAGALYHAIKMANYTYFCFTLIIMGCCFTENILSRQWGITFYACFNYLLFLNAKKD